MGNAAGNLPSGLVPPLRLLSKASATDAFQLKSALKESRLVGHPVQPASPIPIHRRVMLIPATRSLALTVLLVSPALAIAQIVASSATPTPQSRRPPSFKS